MRFKDFLLEKVTKKELSDTLKNDNLWIGAEFEFKLTNVSPDVSENEKMEDAYKDALSDLRDIQRDERDYVDQLNTLEKNIEELEDQINHHYEKAEDTEDENRKRYHTEKYEEYEKQREQAESELEQLRDEPFYYHNDYPDYYGYWREYFDTDSVYLIDNEFPHPPHPTESDEYFGEADFSEYGDWYDAVENVVSEMSQDADFIKIYELGDYKSVTQNKGSDLWAFEYDQTISPDGGVEVKSPPMKLPEFIKILPKILKWIKKWGYTDRDCGLHFHLSLEKGVLDYFKVIVFTEEDLIFKYFPERLHNTYTKEVKEKLLQSTPSSTINVIKRVSKRKVKKDDINLALLGSDKFDAINKISQDQNRVEFRYMGGSGYENKHKEIEELIKRYSFALSVGCDPEWRWKEYIQRLHRVLNKLDKHLLGEELEKMEIEISGLINDAMPRVMHFVRTSRQWEDITEKEKQMIIKFFERKYKQVEERYKNIKVKIPNYIRIHSQIPFKEFYKDLIQNIEKYLNK